MAGRAWEETARMLPDRRVLKQITQQLVENPSWKIIVRNNSWLCPYCGEIGARNLSMNEQIEGKIAAHLTHECTACQNFMGKQLSVEEMRRKAKLVVFKIQVGKWILNDRRYSMATDTDHWICPCCGSLTNVPMPDGDPRSPETYGVAPESTPFLTAVSRHFLQCKAFEKRAVKTQEQLDAIKAKSDRQARFDNVRDRFRKEPEFQLLDMERRWLCPFCASATTVKFEGNAPTEAFFKGIGEHLMVCRSYRKLRGKPRPVDYLKKKVAELAQERKLAQVLQKVQSNPVWRLKDLTRAWYCPYCVEKQGFKVPEKEADGSRDYKDFTGKVFNHLRRCKTYKQRKAAVKPKEYMLKVIQQANLAIKRNRDLMALFQKNPLFTVASQDRSWVCPYCVSVLREVELDPAGSHLKDIDAFESVANGVWSHLGQCRAYQPGAMPRARMEELQAEAMQHSQDMSSPDLGVTAITNEWAKLKQEIEMFHSTESAGEEEFLEKSLESARATLKRLLPQLPRIQGYDFGAEHISSEDIGGDFYDFFAVSPAVWGITVGAVNRRGVQATMNMGLARKLIQRHGRQCRSAHEILSHTNREIYEDLDEDELISCFFGFLNIQTRAFMYARAGLNPLIIYNPKRNPRLSVFETRSMSMGIDDGPIFDRTVEQRNLQLAAGDVLVQYTDGVVTAKNSAREEFGFERVRHIIEQYGHYEAEYLAWKIRRSVELWQDPEINDNDMTVVTMRFL